MSDSNPPSCEPFCYWGYPEPGPAALSLLAPGPLRDRLKALLEDGNAEELREWLATAEIPESVPAILQQGFQGEAIYDAVEVARLVWYDSWGTHTICLARRSGKWLRYEVWQQGERIAEFESTATLTGAELRNLMANGDTEDDDYENVLPFAASSDFHDDLADHAGEDQESLAEDLGEGPDQKAPSEVRASSSDVLEEDPDEDQDEEEEEPDETEEDPDDDFETQFRLTGEFPGGEFAWADLTGVQASGANLEAADFYRACLFGADLHAARLRHADLRQADLRHAWMQGADLEGARLEGADLRHANLRHARLRGADLTHADTRGADFSGADVTACRRESVPPRSA